MYSHPALEASIIRPGQIVKHKYLPDIDLLVVSGPVAGATGEEVYIIRHPEGLEETAHGKNLKK